MKFYIRRKSLLVSEGNMTVEMYKYYYCGMFNIDTVKTYFFLGHLNNLEVSDADVGNAYLHIFTK